MNWLYMVDDNHFYQPTHTQRKFLTRLLNHDNKKKPRWFFFNGAPQTLHFVWSRSVCMFVKVQPNSCRESRAICRLIYASQLIPYCWVIFGAWAYRKHNNFATLNDALFCIHILLKLPDIFFKHYTAVTVLELKTNRQFFFRLFFSFENNANTSHFSSTFLVPWLIILTYFHMYLFTNGDDVIDTK